MFFSMARNIYCKHGYFDENLKIEREKLNRIKENIFQLKEEVGNNLFKDRNCHKCWYSLWQLNYNSIYAYISSNNKPIKRSYDETLSPLQKLLMGLSYVNIHLMTIIYIKPCRLFFLSIFLAIVHLCIYSELFIDNTPSIFYTLTIGICIILFSIFLLFKIMIDLLMIVHYQSMKKILLSK